MNVVECAELKLVPAKVGVSPPGDAAAPDNVIFLVPV